jgi:hypothetical protein
MVLTPASGAVVNTSRPVISGTAEANSTVTVSVDGTVAGTTAANSSGSWSFTPGTALSQGAHSVTARATDAAGNTGSASSSRSFTVDSVAPAAPVVVAPTSGAFVNTTTPVISGTAEAGSTVSVSVDGTVAGTTVANGSGNWSFTPSSALAQGAHTVTARATDAAGNTSPSSNSHAFTVDSVAPAAPVVVTPANGALVNTATPIISGTAEANSTVTVSVDGTVAGTTAANSSGSWSFTPSSALAQGPHSVTAQATDAAGNTSPSSNSHAFTVDSVAPAAPVVVTPADGAFVNTTPVISGTAEAGSTVSAAVDGMVVGTAVANGSGNWSFTPSTTLSQGAHTVTAWATDAAGNISAASNPHSFRVDTVAPQAPVVVTPANGALVNTATPVISGTAEAGSTVSVSFDGTVAGTAVADGSGSWSFTPSSALAQGAHSVTAQATDAAGNTGPSSNSHAFTVDSEAPVAPVVVTPANGALVNTTTPVISGTAEAGSTVSVSVDGTVAGTVVANGTGNWSFTPSSAFSQGLHSVTAQATDTAGNTSPSSNSHSFTVDTVAPAAPVVVTPANSALVSTATPVISGTAEANSTVTVSFDGTVAGTAVANGSGTWSFTPSSALAQGPHSVTAQAMDAAGNTSAASNSHSFTVDSVAPAAPVVVAPASGTFVNTTTPVIFGTAEAGSTVSVSVDGAVVGTAVANGTGSWSFTPSSALSQGPHSVTAQAMDAAGNTSAASNSHSFTVDSEAPAAPVVMTPANGALVNTATPVISGTAEAGSTVSISFNGTVAGTAVANGSGNWSFTPSAALALGLHSVKAKATDAAGNTSLDSHSSSFTVDTVIPAAPVVVTPANDALVNTSTPIISGMAKPGSTVTVSLDGTVAGTALANGSGAWSFTPSIPLAEGAHTLTAQASDMAGNTGPISSPLSFTVDTLAPPAPVLTALPALINTARPAVEGTAEPGSIVTVSLDGRAAGTATATTGGTWSFTPESPLTEGPHTLMATATDAAGNTSPASSPTSFAVDTLAPATPMVTSPAVGAVIDMRTPTFTGTAEVGTTVKVLLDGAEVGTEVVSNTGTWSFTPTQALPVGSHSLAAIGMDAAGNQSLSSPLTSFAIGTRGLYGGCAAAPASLPGWMAVALGLGWLHRRRRGHPPQTPQTLGRLAMLLLCLGSLLSSVAFAQAPTSRTPYPGRRNPHFKDVAQAYDSLRFEKALEAAQRARAAGDNAPHEVLWLHLMEGVIHYELENERAAEEAFIRALAQSLEAQLPVPAPSPKLLEFFQSVRKRVEVTRTAPIHPPEPPQAEAALAPAVPAPPAAVETNSQPELSALTVHREPASESSSLGFMIGLRSEAELFKQGITPALTAELSAGSNARLPEVRLGAALTALFLPMGVRAEGRLYPYDLSTSGTWRLRPYLALGTTYFPRSGSLGGRGSLGAALQLGSLQLFADAAYERFSTSSDTHYYEPNAVLLSLGAGWSPFRGR